MADDRLIPLFDVELGDREIAAVEATLRSGWLTMGPRTQDFEAAFAEHLGVKHAIALSSCTAALHLAYLAAGVGPGDEVIVPAITFVAIGQRRALLRRHAGDRRRGGPARPGARPRRRGGPHHPAHQGGLRRALRRLRGRRGGARAALRGARPGADRGRRPHAERDAGRERPQARAPSAWPGCFSFFSNKVLSCGEGGLLSTDDDGVAEQVRSLRSHAMTSGTWDRHRGHSAGYDVVGLGFNYRMDEPRAALLRRAPRGPRGRHRAAPRARAPLPEHARRRAGR